MSTARALLADGLLDDVPELLLWAVNLDLFDRRDPTTTPELYAALDRMRASGDLTWLPRVTQLLAGREALTGQRAAAEALLVEAELTSRLSGQHTQLLEALVARAEEDALRGDDVGPGGTSRGSDRRWPHGVGTRWLEDALDDARMRAARRVASTRRSSAMAGPLLDTDPDLLGILVDAVRRTDGRRAPPDRACDPRRPPDQPRRASPERSSRTIPTPWSSRPRRRERRKRPRGCCWLPVSATAARAVAARHARSSRGRSAVRAPRSGAMGGTGSR